MSRFTALVASSTILSTLNDTSRFTRRSSAALQRISGLDDADFEFATQTLIDLNAITRVTGSSGTVYFNLSTTVHDSLTPTADLSDLDNFQDEAPFGCTGCSCCCFVCDSHEFHD